jgi:hypothetical protein
VRIASPNPSSPGSQARLLQGSFSKGDPLRLNAHIVNHADELTILCHGTAKAMTAMREMMGRLKLRDNKVKTAARVEFRPVRRYARASTSLRRSLDT